MPEGDISDNHLTNLIDTLVTADTDSQRSVLSSYSKRVMPQLIQALRNRADSLDEVSALAIAIAVARNGDLLPRERGALVIGGTIMYAGILISQLIRRIPLSDRQSAAEAVLGAAFPLAMGMECARWLTHSADRPEERRVLPDGADDALYHLFAVRIRDADDVEPLFMQAGRDAPNLYWYWQHGRNREEIETRLREVFDKDPAKLDDFLDTYIGEGWEVESGLPVRSDLRRESYNSIASIISPNYVFDNLRTRYGAELDAPQYYQDGEPARITAHQFASIHLSIVAEQLPKPEDDDGSGSDPEQSE